MDDAEMTRKVLQFLQDFLGLKVQPDTNLYQAGMDSMQLVMLAAYLEMDLGAPAAGPAADDAKTPATIVQWVRRHTAR